MAAPLLLAAPALAQEADGSLARVVRNGVLRVGATLWAADFVDVEGDATLGMRDGFHEGMARLIADRLGVRVEILPIRSSGVGTRRLLAGETDLSLAVPLTRELLRSVMFCAPHLSLDFVLVGSGTGARNRNGAHLENRKIAALAALIPALAERGAVRTFPALIPLATPWLLVQGLLDGSVDGIIVTNVMARALVRRLPAAGLRSQFVVSSNAFAGAVAYGDHDLVRALNRIIEDLQLDRSLSTLFRQQTGITLSPPFPS